MRTRGLLIVAILAISTSPLYAQGQQPDTTKLKADARNVVGIIGADKDKTQTYCQIVDLGEQIEQAVQGKDYKKTSWPRSYPNWRRSWALNTLGCSSLSRSVNLTSRDGQEIVSMFDTLGDSCPH